MAIIKVVDQNGNPAILGNRLNIRLATAHKTSDQAFDDRFLDNQGTTAWPGVDAVVKTFYPDDFGKGYSLYVNYANVNDNYETSQIYVSNLEQDVLIPINKKQSQPQPEQCPVNWDKTQFTNWFNRIKVGGIVTTANMVAMKSELVKCGFEWQNMVRSPNNPSDWRPRIHQPPFINGPGSGSDHDVDCGDFGSVWVLTFRY